MSTKILYLLGAGASANAMPLIKGSGQGFKPGLPQELNLFILQLQPYIKPELFSRLQHLTSHSMEFGTPDLYAKFLLETGDDENYQLLKKLMSEFFMVIQAPKQQYGGYGYNRFDKRVLAFLTMIADRNKIQENIHVLSWNYDRQLEMAASRLRKKTAVESDMIRGFSCWPNTMDGDASRSPDKTPFLIHINGVAGYVYSDINFLNKIELRDFSDKEEDTFLSFAWEDEQNDNKITFHASRMQKIQKAAAETQILVIIGYSFPFFNRKIDSALFRTLKSSLTKIYIQDQPEYVNQLAKQLISQFDISPIVKENIILIGQTDNYHIPFEL